MGKILGGLFGGGGGSKKQASSQPAAGTKKLFSPEQVQKATQDYTNQGQAKWGQILSNMGAGGGTGGDLTGAISNQASTMGQKLSELTDASGYGSDPTANMQQILKDIEGGIGAKYSVY